MSSEPHNSPCFTPAGAGEYSFHERGQLIRLAHQAIEAALSGVELDLTPPTEHLAQRRGAFTTLHLDRQLRGCVGYVIDSYALWRTVAETAVAAAFYDTRFYPVTAEEARRLEIEISVLSPARPIEPEEVEVGRHGLIVSHCGQRGLLLPQVPIEHGWNRELFLAQTCLKAGLPMDAWLNGAYLEAFTAEVFSEAEPGAVAP
ncbi:MAG TPA: AmmeMemoRadiSam system protein A [Terriglobales bacterium]|nr:AmmeMemoRadiSam system protein A [Terriglobales bacterium]